MRWVVLFIFLLSLLLGSSAFGNDFVPYVSQEVGFSISFPAEWEVENPPRFYYPGLIMCAHLGPTNVWITHEYRYYPSFSSFQKRVRDDILLFPGVNIIGEGETKIAGVPAYFYVYTFPGGDKNMKAVLYLFARGEGFFRIICWTSESSFESLLPVFERIALSFSTRRGEMNKE